MIDGNGEAGDVSVIISRRIRTRASGGHHLHVHGASGVRRSDSRDLSRRVRSEAHSRVETEGDGRDPDEVGAGDYHLIAAGQWTLVGAETGDGGRRRIGILSPGAVGGSAGAGSDLHPHRARAGRHALHGDLTGGVHGVVGSGNHDATEAHLGDAHKAVSVNHHLIAAGHRSVGRLQRDDGQTAHVQVVIRRRIRARTSGGHHLHVHGTGSVSRSNGRNLSRGVYGETDGRVEAEVNSRDPDEIGSSDNHLIAAAHRPLCGVQSGDRRCPHVGVFGGRAIRSGTSGSSDLHPYRTRAGRHALDGNLGGGIHGVVRGGNRAAAETHLGHAHKTRSPYNHFVAACPRSLCGLKGSDSGNEYYGPGPDHHGHGLCPGQSTTGHEVLARADGAPQHHTTQNQISGARPVHVHYGRSIGELSEQSLALGCEPSRQRRIHTQCTLDAAARLQLTTRQKRTQNIVALLPGNGVGWFERIIGITGDDSRFHTTFHPDIEDVIPRNI
ncbi:MAG: hypothetical protein BWY79_01131 [Actinobacteria bacterium ADurb.Bin444]|nr:MAG: hypothetical protein BWY79_01131 [Actinobacteria bacterium ADurb.Bin444]